MEILEFGDTNKRKIILIHGFQSPYHIAARSVPDIRRPVRMTGQFPGLSEHFAVKIFPVPPYQPAPAPQIVLAA